MGGQLTEKLAPPQDLRPAQLGIILVGRVIVGHIGATLIDLRGRVLSGAGVPAALAPYMMIFGLAAAPPPGLPVRSRGRASTSSPRPGVPG